MLGRTATVSYTHLDVYKRQAVSCVNFLIKSEFEMLYIMNVDNRFENFGEFIGTINDE